jgi:uncharacterized protein YodC (DUF2158 family)
MPHKFKPNDRVQLKSGSHAMIIVGNATIPAAEGKIAIKDKYECSWFDGVKSQKAIFKEEDIVLIERQK